MNNILERPKMNLRKMKSLIFKRYNNNMRVGQCRNAKKLALYKVEGSLKEHYVKLWDQVAKIRMANPSSDVKVYLEPHHDNTMVFDRFYVS